VDAGVLLKAGARIGPYAVVGRQCHIEEEARVAGAILWQNTRVGREAVIQDAVLGRNCHIGRNVSLNHGAVLGDKSALTDYTRA
jgi:NDP-sugar pyrophosphorylase family protein